MTTQASAALQAEVNRLQLEIQSLKVEQGSEQISIGNYLLSRLEQLGVTVRGTISVLVRLSCVVAVHVWRARGLQPWFSGRN
jgi:hypothetical protein